MATVSEAGPATMRATRLPFRTAGPWAGIRDIIAPIAATRLSGNCDGLPSTACDGPRLARPIASSPQNTGKTLDSR